jgi:hypothetical protein
MAPAKSSTGVLDPPNKAHQIFLSGGLFSLFRLAAGFNVSSRVLTQSTATHTGQHTAAVCEPICRGDLIQKSLRSVSVLADHGAE